MSNVEKHQFANPAPSVHHTLALWAADCAEHTLHLFEEKYPNDKRPRFALEALRQWVRGELEMVKCREAAFEAHAAARNAEDKAAVAAARATGQAVAVAHMYTHAPYAADYAAKAASFAVPADQANAAMIAEREWQWDRLRDDLRALGFPKGK